jgi:hypothetical protein
MPVRNDARPTPLVFVFQSKKPPSAGGFETEPLRLQLFSLLARFHEISSPIVELVLETGCL